VSACAFDVAEQRADLMVLLQATGSFDEVCPCHRSLLLDDVTALFGEGARADFDLCSTGLLDGAVVEVVSTFRFLSVLVRAQLIHYIWRRTLPLSRDNEGKLTATLPINFGEKITFKVCSRVSGKL